MFSHLNAIFIADESWPSPELPGATAAGAAAEAQKQGLFGQQQLAPSDQLGRFQAPPQIFAPGTTHRGAGDAAGESIATGHGVSLRYAW